MTSIAPYHGFVGGSGGADSAAVSANASSIATLNASQAAQDALIAAAPTQAEVDAIKLVNDKQIKGVARLVDQSLLVTFQDDTTTTVTAPSGDVTKADQTALDAEIASTDAEQAAQDGEIALRELLSNKATVVRDAATATDVAYPNEKAVRDAIDALNFAGVYKGSAATVAALPAGVNGDWAILHTDDGANVAGIYVTDGTTYTLAKEIPDLIALSAAQITATTNPDQAVSGTVSARRLDQWYFSRTTGSVQAMTGDLDISSLGRPIGTMVAYKNTTATPFTLTYSALATYPTVINGVAGTGGSVIVNPGQMVIGQRNTTSFNFVTLDSTDEVPLLTEARITALTGVDYTAEGVVSAERLDQWGVSRRRQRIFDLDAGFDYTALNYPDKTALFLRNRDAVNGVPITYGAGGAVTLVVTNANGVQQTITGQDVFSNLQPNEFAVFEKDGNTARLSIVSGERVSYFTNYADAALNAATRVAHDGIAVIRDVGEFWGRTTLINSVAFPADGVPNADWFKVGGSQPAIANWEPNTAYAVGDKVVAAMPLNADFIADDGAIANLNYIFEATQVRPNTIAAFDEAEADSGAWRLVGAYRVDGTDDRVIPTSGIYAFDPLTSLSNTGKSEYIRWVTIDNPVTARFTFDPSSITVWKDYTGTGIAQPTAINEDVVIPANSEFVAHRQGNAVHVTISPNAVTSASATQVAPSMMVGNRWIWNRSDAVPDHLLPLNGQVVATADADYPDLWSVRSLSTLIASFDDTAKTITLKDYNGEGRFARAGTTSGVEQDDATAANGLSATVQTVPRTASERQTGNNYFRPGDGTVQSLVNRSVSVTSSDTETRPINVTEIWCIIAKPWVVTGDVTINQAATDTNDQAVSGYMDIGTMRMQWGTAPNGSTGTVTLPAPFASANYSVTANAKQQDRKIGIPTQTATSFNYTSTNSGGGLFTTLGMHWQAIGLKP